MLYVNKYKIHTMTSPNGLYVNDDIINKYIDTHSHIYLMIYGNQMHASYQPHNYNFRKSMNLHDFCNLIKMFSEFVDTITTRNAVSIAHHCGIQLNLCKKIELSSGNNINIISFDTDLVFIIAPIHFDNLRTIMIPKIEVVNIPFCNFIDIMFSNPQARMIYNEGPVDMRGINCVKTLFGDTVNNEINKYKNIRLNILALFMLRYGMPLAHYVFGFIRDYINVPIARHECVIYVDIDDN